MPTPTLTLPSLVAGRDLADSFVDKIEFGSGSEVIVDAHSLVSGTSSFASQLVRRILVDGHADELHLVGAPASFVAFVRDAAVKLDVSDQLVTQDLAANV